MSRASEFQLKYGVLAAGAVGKSLLALLARKAVRIGPVAAVSYRVASRISNVLRAGYSVRSATELNTAPVILFHTPAAQQAILLELLDGAGIHWPGKTLVFCDCDITSAAMERFERHGASTASIRRFGIPAHVAVAGRAAALTEARKIARDLRMTAIEIAPAALDLFDSAVTLASAAATPLIDHAVGSLRQAGVRDSVATRAICALFEQTARDYAHSGKQSWPWYTREPERDRIDAEIAAAGPRAGPVLRDVLLLGLDSFGKHAGLARHLRHNSGRGAD